MRLLVLAKEPVPGLVKTRLTPPFRPHQAAALAAAALADTLAAACAVPGVQPLLVLDGRPGPWLPRGLAWVPQSAGALDDRLGAAFDGCAGEPALLVGMDTPQLTPRLLTEAVTATRQGAALGLAADGGWWALGLASPDGDLLRGIPTSVADTGALQRRRLKDAGLRVADLPVLRDVDTADDAWAVAVDCPDTAFARLLAELDRVGAA